MKTAIYIEDGTVQVVITPETPFEKASLKMLGEDAQIDVKVFRGAFYDCRGGWVRQKHYTPLMENQRDGDDSLILRMVKVPPPQALPD